MSRFDGVDRVGGLGMPNQKTTRLVVAEWRRAELATLVPMLRRARRGHASSWRFCKKKLTRYIEKQAKDRPVPDGLAEVSLDETHECSIMDAEYNMFHIHSPLVPITSQDWLYF